MESGILENLPHFNKKYKFIQPWYLIKQSIKKNVILQACYLQLMQFHWIPCFVMQFYNKNICDGLLRKRPICHSPPNTICANVCSRAKQDVVKTFILRWKSCHLNVCNWQWKDVWNWFSKKKRILNPVRMLLRRKTFKKDVTKSFDSGSWVEVF